MGGDDADIIYLDLSKSFDIVFYYRFLLKMKRLDISKKIVNIVW